MPEYEIAYRVNRNHKDTVFRDLFGSEENRENALSLYNALRGTSYTDPSIIEITTLSNVLYMGVKNDISFLIDNETVLWEHQSTYNPNMPLRALSYFAHLYTKWVQDNDYSFYDYQRIPLPKPRYVVFYIGEEDRPDCEVMKLSDSFIGVTQDDETSILEVVATSYNVNVGHNDGLVSACSALAGYSHLIATIRVGQSRGMSIDDAVDWAIEQCIAEDVLADYLMRRRAEVRDMLLTEFDMEDTARRIAKRHATELISEGKRIGEEEQHKAFLARAAEAVSGGALTAEEASDLFGFGIDEIEQALFN